MLESIITSLLYCVCLFVITLSLYCVILRYTINKYFTDTEQEEMSEKLVALASDPKKETVIPTLFEIFSAIDGKSHKLFVTLECIRQIGSFIRWVIVYLVISIFVIVVGENLLYLYHLIF